MSSANPLQRVLYWLSKDDPLSAAVACESILLTGAPGSGKSSTAMMQLIMAFLTAGYGGIFLTAKSEDTRNYIRYIRRAGREKDLIVFSLEGKHAFDGLHYMYHRPGRASGLLESVIDIFSTLMAIGAPNAGTSNEPFWERKSEQLMRAAITVLSVAGEPVSIASIDELIASFPKLPGQYETPEWQQGRCGQVLQKIRERKEQLTERQWNDFGRALRFVCEEWPALGVDGRVQASILATWTSLADKLLYEPFLSLFSSGKCTFIPEQITQDNKLVIVDFPCLEGGDAFRIATCFVKLVFHQALLRRDVEKHPTPCFIAADECQLFTLPRGRDNAFQQVCRSARCATLYATQNLMQLAEAHGEHHLGPKTKGWISNIGTRIAFQNNCPDSNEYLAQIIGKHIGQLGGVSAGHQVTINRTEHLLYKVEPHEFTRLQRASPVEPIAEAIVYKSTPFEVTKTKDNPRGENYLHVGFPREKE